jgi:hypothetical protein
MKPFVQFSGECAPRPLSEPAVEITALLPPCIMLCVNQGYSIVPIYTHFKGGTIGQWPE